ncbi:MAG: flagellar biosynthesis protein FlhA [Clostridia bacterium]|nr:flagellar biosynthesis protein FlhA [Clostridia bacterium]
MARVARLLTRVGASDLILAVAVVTVVMMMVIPLPAWLLSLLISLNIAVSLAVLLATTYLTDPLELSVFPSLLLVTTLFRLALNVSATRLILLYGDAGEVIRKFGQFVVGGNPVVGFVIFLILVLIQFLVITRGAERVAEVAARFTLDAMPGKQMAIDADLNAGLIDEAEARRRRAEIEREADFYGAMDGASKFVRGDAIAALVIIAINIVGGFAVGIWQHGMAWSDALQTYTLLTVGDGLSAQIPALLISTATGMVVTRAASEANLGEEMRSQVLTRPRPLVVAGAALGALSLVPGLPKLPFMVLAAALLLTAWQLARRAQTARREAPKAERRPPTTPEEAAHLVVVDPMEIDLGYGLLPLAEGEGGGDLMARIGAIRRQVATDLGLVLPLVRVRDDVQLPPQSYRVRVRGVEVGTGELYLERFLAIDPGGLQDAFTGIPTREPAFGLPAMWIRAEDRAAAEAAGYTVVDPASVIATHLMEIVRSHAAELLTRQEVKAMLDVLREENASLVDEVVPGVVPLGTVHRVLQNLLRERVPVRDLATILETLGDAGRETKDADALTEAVRASLARVISSRLPVEDGTLAAVALAPEVEEDLARALASGQGALSPARLQEIRRKAHDAIQSLRAQGTRPVIVCAPGARLAFRRLIERQHADVPVVAYHELAGDISVKAVKVVE